MTTPETTTQQTTYPYPTIEDKVKLFQEHGLVPSERGEGIDDDDGLPYQSVVFSNIVDAGAAGKLAKDQGIRIHEFAITWPYGDDNEPEGDAYGVLVF